MSLPAVFLPTTAVPTPLIVDDTADGYDALRSDIVAGLYKEMVEDFEKTPPPDPVRLGVPLPDGTQDRATFVPRDDLLTLCQAHSLLYVGCAELLLSYAINQERRYWEAVVQKPADGVTRESRTPLEDVLRVMHAREGVRIDPKTGVGTWLCREHVPELVKDNKHRLTWRETLGHLLRARHWYPYHDGRCLSPLHGGRSVQPTHAIDGHVPDELATAAAWANPASYEHQNAGHWNYGDRVYEYGADPPAAAFTFNHGRDEMTLHEAAAYLAAGQQAVVLKDVLNVFGAELPRMNDARYAGKDRMDELTRTHIPKDKECPNASIQKAKWVLDRYGPVDAWRIYGEQVRLSAIEPGTLRFTLDRAYTPNHGGEQGGGGIRMRHTWGANVNGRIYNTLINEGLLIVNAFRASKPPPPPGSVLWNAPPPPRPAELAGLPSNMLHMSQINWKIGAWFLSGKNTPPVEPCRLYSLTHAYEDNEYFNQYIGDWDTSDVKFASRAFYNATSFNQPLRNWDVENLEGFYLMFANAAKFDQGVTTLNGWAKWVGKDKRLDPGDFRKNNIFVECTALARRILTWQNSLSSTGPVREAQAMGWLLERGPPAWW